MKSQTKYSIIYAVTRSEIAEKVSVGIMLLDDFQFVFCYSKRKLAALKILMSQAEYSFMKRTLENLETESKKGFSLHQDYLHYLERYANNFIAVSETCTIDATLNEDLRNMLFKQYVDNYQAVVKTKKYILKIKENFFPKVKPFYNIAINLTQEDIKELVIPIKIDLIGKNDIPVYAQFIDLEKAINYIRADMASLFILDSVWNKKKAFIVASEPDKNTASHNYWKGLREWKGGEYIDVSEVEKIEEYAQIHGVVPFCQ